MPYWQLESYISGYYDPNYGKLRVEESAKGDEAEDGDVEGACGNEVGWRASRREVIRGSAGPLDYIRADHFTGW